MLSFIKRFIPSYIKHIYRFHGNMFYYYNKITNLKKNDSHCFLIGTPVHENLGDHLITFAELLFLNNNGYKNIIEIPIESYKLFKSIIKEKVNSDSIIFIQGGGWMGTVWPDDELLIQDIIRTFQNHKIIVFPQTAYYEKDKNYSKIIKSGKSVYKGENLHVFVRDQLSYITLKQIYPLLNVELQPDISLYLCDKINLSSVRENQKIGICFRGDREESNSELKHTIYNFLSKHCDYCNNIAKIDTISSRAIQERDRTQVINNKFKEFSSFSLIITDRLHGMLFAYILGIPCIAIDNRTHKVLSVYKTWLNDSTLVHLINSFEDFTQVLLRYETQEAGKINVDFNLLEGAVYNG